MTYYVNLRSQRVGGPIVDPWVGEGDRENDALRPLSWSEVASLAAGRDVLFAVHGFNVARDEGIRSLGRLEKRFAPTGSELFFGVLWPGDYWIPVVNYPAEASDAVQCGVRLADFCSTRLQYARSLSFLSHSLGGRLVLEAVKNLDHQARTVCLTATAVDWDCLDNQYAAAAVNAKAISTLSSNADMVLKLAYLAGDFISDVLFSDGDNPLQKALGLSGPKLPAPATVKAWQIANKPPYGHAYDHAYGHAYGHAYSHAYGHGDYFPPSGTAAPTANQPWEMAADFMIRAFREQQQSWP